MTRPLSPAAQAVKDAAMAHYAPNIPRDEHRWQLERPGVVAALRAAATALKPDDGQSHQVGGIISARLQLLAIANELDPRP